MTRRVAITGVLAVCFTALLVGIIAYVLVARDARQSENRVLVNLATHPAGTLAPRTTYSQLAQLSTRRGIVVKQTAALQTLGQLPALKHGYANVVLKHHHLRVYTVKLRKHFFFSVAVSDAPARASLTRLRRGVLIGMGAAVLLVSLLLVWITRRALAPVRQTAAVADRIVSTGDLSARVPQPPGTDEIAQLSQSINGLLAHVEASDAALRRLVADASHELRSPVTTLRGNLELLETGALSEADQIEALADARAEAERLGRLVEELLTLARADTANPDASVELAELIDEAIIGTGASFSVTDPGLDTATVRGDPVSLRAMVRNLAENAARYGGGAEVTLAASGTALIITVADHGPGVPPAERDAIFGRFSRGVNSAGQPGSGLGLAIVAATARSHGGSVSVGDTAGGGATFTVRLPRSPESADRAAARSLWR